MANQVNVGDLLRLDATFKNIDGELTDPSTVSIIIKEPDGTILTKVYGVDAITRVGVGNYVFDFSITKKGMHRYWGVGTGLVQAVEESTFRAYPGAPS